MPEDQHYAAFSIGAPLHTAVPSVTAWMLHLTVAALQNTGSCSNALGRSGSCMFQPLWWCYRRW